MKKIIVFSLFLLTCQFAFSQQWEQLGADIDGEAAGDWAGFSVSLNDDGSIMAIGAINNDGNGSNSGHVRIFQWNGVDWDQLGDDINGEAAGDWAGHSVSLNSDGSIVAIGADHNDGGGSNSGHVRVYQWDGISWNQMGQNINGAAAGDRFSYASLSLNDNGNIVAVGAAYNDGNEPNSGHTRIYQFDGVSWSQMGQDINGEAANDYSGRSVRLSGNGSRVAIGAGNNDRSAYEEVINNIHIYFHFKLQW